MKGRAAASPNRAGVTGVLAGIAAIGRCAAALRAGSRLALVALLAAVALAAHSPVALAQSSGPLADFTVSDIKVEGLQRVSEGTVYNYLPVNIGDHLTPQRVREAIRALYATGFFRNVQMRRDGSTLIVEIGRAHV